MSVTVALPCPRMKEPATMRRNPENSVAHPIIAMWMLMRRRRCLMSLFWSESNFRSFVIEDLCCLEKINCTKQHENQKENDLVSPQNENLKKDIIEEVKGLFTKQNDDEILENLKKKHE